MKKLILLVLLSASISAAATVNTAPLPPVQPQFFKSDGITPLAVGCVFTYQAGTTTPLASYTDGTGSTANANPVILNAGGFASPGIWLGPQKYKIKVVADDGLNDNCASGVTQYTVDNVYGPNLPLSGTVSFTAQAAPTCNAANYSMWADSTAVFLKMCNNGTIDTVAGVTATQTLTNKTLTSPTINSATLNTATLNTPTVTGTLTTAGITDSGVSNFKNSNGTRYANNFANIQAAITDAGTSGSVEIPASYSGTDTYTNPSNIPISDLRGGPLRRAAIERVGSLTLTATTGSMAAGTYFLNITAVDAQGGEGMITRQEQSIAVGASSGITATWPAVSGASSYNLYIGTASLSYLQVYNVVGTSTTITQTPVAGPTGLTLTAVADATSTLKGDEFAFSVTAFVNGAETVRDDTKIATIQLPNADTNADRIDASWSAVTGATKYRIYVSSDRSGSRRVLLYYTEVTAPTTTYSLKTQETNLTFRPYWGNTDQVSSGAIYLPAAYFTSDSRITTNGQFMTQPIGEGDAAYISDRASASGQFAGLSIRTAGVTKWQWGTNGAANDQLTLNSKEASGSNVLTVNGAAAGGVPMFVFYRPGTDEATLAINTDASATARIFSQNNGSNFWEMDFVHGATKKFLLQSPTGAWLTADDTNNILTLGKNSSAVTTFNGGVIPATDNSSVFGNATNRWSSVATVSATMSTTNSGVYQTATNCSSSASPAACGSAAAGRFVIAAGSTSVVVDTSAVTANSEIFIQPDSSLGTALSVTCNTTGTLLDAEPWVSARVAATSFTVTVNAAPSTNPECFSYQLVN